MVKHSVLHSFYNSKRWREFRVALITERSNRCERCESIVPKSMDLHAHHEIELTPENVHDAMTSLNPEKIKLICRSCHDKEHHRFGYHGRASKKVYVVYGPPMSGKAQYVQHHMKRGDIVVNIDTLYQAISGLPEYDKPDNLFSNVIGVHNKLIDNIKTRFGKWNNAWVISTLPDKFKRERLAAELGAELIFCDVSRQECLSRLELDRDRRYRKDEWRGYIEKWFESYTE